MAALVLVSSCGGRSAPSLSAETASFDIAVGRNDRLMVGVSDNDGNVLVGGKVRFTVAPISGQGKTFVVEASFIAVPGRPAPSAAAKPQMVEPADGVGVYSAPNVTFPAPGPWEITVDAGGAGKAVTAVVVNEKHLVPMVGDKAPLTENPTVFTPGVTPGELDSSAKDASLAELTDRILHTTSVAAAIGQRRPVVVVVSTPVYCVSRFCGPTTDQVAALASAHPKVTFVHLEVWKNFDRGQVSPFAAQWISPGADATADASEPWVFTVDTSGMITKRWDDVLDVGALATELTRLVSSPDDRTPPALGPK